MAFFPLPFPEETIYSIILRCMNYYKISLSCFLDYFFKKNRYRHFSDGLFHIIDIAKNLTNFMDEYYILNNHTNFNYLTAFFTELEANKLKNMVLNPEMVNYDILYPIKSYSSHDYVKGIKKFCKYCITEQIKEYSESWWLREWSIIGLEICEKHKTALSYISLNNKYNLPSDINMNECQEIIPSCKKHELFYNSIKILNKERQGYIDSEFFLLYLCELLENNGIEINLTSRNNNIRLSLTSIGLSELKKVCKDFWGEKFITEMYLLGNGMGKSRYIKNNNRDSYSTITTPQVLLLLALDQDKNLQEILNILYNKSWRH